MKDKSRTFPRWSGHIMLLPSEIKAHPHWNSLFSQSDNNIDLKSITNNPLQGFVYQEN
jgi:hypothetical protein